MPLKYGINWPDGFSDLHIELIAFREGTKAGGGEDDDRPYHFKQVTKMLWGPKSKRPYQWDPWTDKMLLAACEHKYVWLSGCAGCVSGETRILNPITGESPTVKELYDRASGTTVMTLYGPAQATAPFVKGYEELYEIRLGSGEKFTCSGEHRVLAERGYVHARELSVGQVLFGYEHVLQGSILGNGLSIHGEGVLSSRKKAEGFQVGCHDVLYYDGGQLLEARESDQSSSPSPAGARQYTSCALGSSDVQENESSRSHPHQLFDRPSTNHSLGHNSLSQIYPSHRSFGGRLKRDACWFLSSWRFSSGSYRYGIIQKSNLGSCSTQNLEQCGQFSGLEFHKNSESFLRSELSDEKHQQQRECFYTPETSRLFDDFSPSIAQQSSGCAQSGVLGSYCYTVTQTVVASIRKTQKQLFYDLSVPGIEHYFAEGAIHHNSGKSTFLALWGLVNWLCSPANTLVLICSTSLADARRRIWGEVEEYFTAGCESLNAIRKGLSLPGKLIGSLGMIRTDDAGSKFSNLCGIQLIAGDPSHEKDALRKIGFHNKRVFVELDELTELSPTLVKAARANLVVNEHFHLSGAGNFKSIFDQLGINAEPIGGWGSVSPDFDQWETKDGLCLRFDGLKSPNLLEGQRKYKGRFDATHLKELRESFGDNSAEFWRFCRSYPCPEADVNRIYSEADLVKGGVRDLVKWRDIPVDVASLDPSFATGGDKAIGNFGKLGVSIAGVQTLLVSERKEYREDIRKKDENKALQIAKLFRDDCIQRNIKPENVGYDGTGGAFSALVTEIWSPKLLSVLFGGAASEKPASFKDRRPARQVFQNRVTEIWFAGVPFVQSGQIKGLPAQCCAELVERRKHKQGNIIHHNRVESKDEMKKRTGGRSPDDADAFLILLELCRERLQFRAIGMEGKQASVHLDWKRRVMLSNRIYQHGNYTTQETIAA